MIMMGFTKDGQLDKQMLAERDKRFGVSTSENRKKREDIPMPKVEEGANAWEKGEVRQFIITENADSALNKHH